LESSLFSFSSTVWGIKTHHFLLYLEEGWFICNNSGMNILDTTGQQNLTQSLLLHCRENKNKRNMHWSNNKKRQ